MIIARPVSCQCPASKTCTGQPSIPFNEGDKNLYTQDGRMLAASIHPSTFPYLRCQSCQTTRLSVRRYSLFIFSLSVVQPATDWCRAVEKWRHLTNIPQKTHTYSWYPHMCAMTRQAGWMDGWTVCVEDQLMQKGRPCISLTMQPPHLHEQPHTRPAHHRSSPEVDGEGLLLLNGHIHHTNAIGVTVIISVVAAQQGVRSSRSIRPWR